VQVGSILVDGWVGGIGCVGLGWVGWIGLGMLFVSCLVSSCCEKKPWSKAGWRRKDRKWCERVFISYEENS
jgi:hypothetical protein